MNRLTITILMPCAFILAACSSHSTLETQFGNAVRQVSTDQTHDVGAALYRSDAAAEGADPYQLENVLDVHRADVSRPETVSQPVTIDIGGGSRN